MTGITPWASGSAGRLLFLEALTLSSRFGETAREAVFLFAHLRCPLLAQSGHYVCPAKKRIRAQNGPLNSYTVCFVVPSHLVLHP